MDVFFSCFQVPLWFCHFLSCCSFFLKLLKYYDSDAINSFTSRRLGCNTPSVSPFGANLPLKTKSKLKQIQERIDRNNGKRKPTTKRLTKVDKKKKSI